MVEAPKLETHEETVPPALWWWTGRFPSRQPEPWASPHAAPPAECRTQCGTEAVFTAAKGPASLQHGRVVLSTAGRPHSAAASASVSMGPVGPGARHVSQTHGAVGFHICEAHRVVVTGTASRTVVPAGHVESVSVGKTDSSGHGWWGWLHHSGTYPTPLGCTPRNSER